MPYSIFPGWNIVKDEQLRSRHRTGLSCKAATLMLGEMNDDEKYIRNRGDNQRSDDSYCHVWYRSNGRS